MGEGGIAGKNRKQNAGKGSNMATAQPRAPHASAKCMSRSPRLGCRPVCWLVALIMTFCLCSKCHLMSWRLALSALRAHPSTCSRCCCCCSCSRCCCCCFARTYSSCCWLFCPWAAFVRAVSFSYREVIQVHASLLLISPLLCSSLD